MCYKRACIHLQTVCSVQDFFFSVPFNNGSIIFLIRAREVAGGIKNYNARRKHIKKKIQ